MNRPFFEVVLLIKRTCTATEDRIAREFSLRQADINGLLAIDPGEKVTGQEFSARMGVSPSRGSRILASMVRRGFLNASAAPGNRRSVRISLTAAGRKRKSALVRRMNACGERLLSPLSRSDRGRLTDAFGLIETAFDVPVPQRRST